MSPQRSDLLPTLHGTLGLIGAGLVGVGLGIGVAAGIFHGRAPVEATTPTDETSQGYRVTDHVRDYYASTRL